MWLINKFLSLVARKQFIKNAIVGNNVEIGRTARCINKSNKEKIKIGENCSIWATLFCDEGGQIKIGPYSTIRYKTIINSAMGINIGKYSIISNNVTIFDHNSHPTAPKKRIDMCKEGFFYGDLWSSKHAEKSKVTIEDNVWIGQNALILKGVTIGKGSIVASNAVVTKSVPPYSIAAGNPAKIVKQIKEDN